MSLDIYKPNTSNITGFIIGLVSGLFTLFLSQSSQSYDFELYFGLLFGAFSSITILYYSIDVKFEASFFKYLVWFLACGLSWFAALYVAVLLSVLDSFSSLTFGSVVGSIILLVGAKLMGLRLSFLTAGMIVFILALISLLCSVIIDNETNIVHVLWQSIMLYMIISHVRISGEITN